MFYKNAIFSECLLSLRFSRYDELPNPANENRNGMYTHACSIQGIRLGKATASSKKESKNAAAKVAFERLLKSAGLGTM